MIIVPQSRPKKVCAGIRMVRIKMVKMKKVLLYFNLWMILLCMVTMVKAQQPIHTAPDRAAKVTQWMQDSLRLIGSQRSQLYQINLKYAYKMEELKSSTISSREKVNIFNANDKARDEEVKNVLTADQFKIYLAKKTEIFKKFRIEMKQK